MFREGWRRALAHGNPFRLGVAHGCGMWENRLIFERAGTCQQHVQLCEIEQNAKLNLSGMLFNTLFA